MLNPYRSLKSWHATLVLCLWTFFLPACSLPNPYIPCSVDALIDQINIANTTPATMDTINLSAGCIYLLQVTDNKTDGHNGLPVITSPIVINGKGATIQRDIANPEWFRFFYVAGTGDLVLTDLVLEGGYSYNATDPDDTFTNSGGAIFNRGKVTIRTSSIRKNFAYNQGEGGGILNFGTLELFDSTLDGNEDGLNTILGGAALSNWAEATITGSTFSHNGHLADQDAIFTQGTLRMTNSTISDSGWDGIDGQYGDIFLNYVTIAYNRSFALAGVSGHWYVTNSLFALNRRGNCTPSLPLSNPPASNIMDTDGTCGGLTVAEVDLHLAPLGNYGGLTETHALEAGSRAIDQVQPSTGVYTHLVTGCIPTDQRGEPRPYGTGCDLGSYEYRGDGVAPVPMLASTITTAPVSCTYTTSVDLNCRSGPGTLLYPVIDFLSPGQTISVVGRSLDGNYLYLVAPHISGYCVVPANPGYGTLTGEACGLLAVFTPLPVPPTTTGTRSPGGTTPQPGCTVPDLTTGVGVKCVVPCPEGAIPGEPCTP